MPRGPAPMLPPRKRFVTPPHPEGRLQRHIKTLNFAAGIAQGRRESAFPRPFATCGCVSDAYTTHCPLLWGHVHTLSMLFSQNLRKIFCFPAFSRVFSHFFGPGFQVFFQFLLFSHVSSRFLRFHKSRARGARSGANGARLPAKKPAPALSRWQACAPGPLPSRAGRGFARRIFRRRPSVRGPFGPPCAYSAVPVWGMCSRRMSTPSCASSCALAARPPA